MTLPPLLFPGQSLRQYADTSVSYAKKSFIKLSPGWYKGVKLGWGNSAQEHTGSWCHCFKTFYY